MDNKVYIIAGGDDYSASDYEDKFGDLSLKEIYALDCYDKDRRCLSGGDFYIDIWVLDVEPSDETEELISDMRSFDLLDYDLCKHNNIYLINKE